MTVQGIHLAWIVVRELKAAIKYYTETLGFTLDVYQEEYGWAELSGESGARLGIAQQSAKEKTNDDSLSLKAGVNAIIAITVENLDKTLAAYKSKGVKLIGMIQIIPGQVKLQTFVDPDGNHFQIAELLKS